MKAPKLTKEQAIIIAGYTGYDCGPFADLHNDVAARLGRPVYTHEFVSRKFETMLRDLYRADFIAITYGDDK